jgi:lipid-A-disaccharide synthase
MRFYIIAGEASGDLHASNLVKAMRAIHTGSEFRGIGGDLMMAQEVSLLLNYRETAFMGFWEVIKNLRRILGYINQCKKDILQWKPDAIILVDYPGFNLRIADFAREAGIKVFYYISPQVWAWKSSRVKKIRRDVDRMFVILPFEKEFYRKWNYEVDFVGHPLLDAIASHDFSTEINVAKRDHLIALLPGSRKQEIAEMLPLMMKIVPSFPDHHFVIAGLGSIEENFYRQLMGNGHCSLVIDQTYSLLSIAKAALVTSGTATLETALFNVPEVVCYKGSPLSFWIGRQLVDVKYISLVNLILDRPLLKELIQQEFIAANLVHELNEILFDEKKRRELASGYKELKEKLGGAGASQKTAALILQQLGTSKT